MAKSLSYSEGKDWLHPSWETMYHASWSFHLLQRVSTLELCVYFNPVISYQGIYRKEVILDGSKNLT